MGLWQYGPIAFQFVNGEVHAWLTDREDEFVLEPAEAPFRLIKPVEAKVQGKNIVFFLDGKEISVEKP